MRASQVFGILRKNVAKYDDVKAALVGLGLEPQKALNQVAWESVLGSPVREVWAHYGKCACGKRTYLFGQCPSCIRQEVGERALADQEAREAARVDVVPEDGVPAVDLVGSRLRFFGQSRASCQTSSGGRVVSRSGAFLWSWR